MQGFVLVIFFAFVAAQASDESCAIVPITQWGKTLSNRAQKLQLPVSIVVIQHTATPDCNTDEECEAQLNKIRALHINTYKFDDIANSLLIGGNGKVYEGAGWHNVGAHTRGYNSRSFGISFIGNFIDKLPTDEALKSLETLLACGVANKYLTEDYQLVAHSQLSNTLSPGETLMRHIQLLPHWLDHAKEVLG